MSRIIENQFFLPPRALNEAELLTRLRPNDPQEKLMYGFLGVNEQLQTVIARDNQTLDRLQVTHEQIARTIEDIFLHMPYSINGCRLHLFDYIHSPLCPWDDFCAVSPFDYSQKVTEIWLCNSKHYWKLKLLLRWWNKEERLTRLRKLVENDWVMVLSDLHPHLIRDHKFFQGHDTPYRVDPERFIRFVGKENVYPYTP